MSTEARVKLIKYQGNQGNTEYFVKETTNTLSPQVGEVLDHDKVQDLITIGKQVTIVPSKYTFYPA